MKPRVFISAVTSELQESRQLVARVLERLGYEPIRQEIFGTESGDLRQMLRESIDDCEGLIQLVGYAYGAEPPTIGNEFEEDGFTRVSYTQFEFLYARSRNKRTWLIYLDEGYELARPLSELDLPRDAISSTPSAYQAERRALQQKYRDHWKSDGHIRHAVKNVIELELKIERLKDEFAQLRKDFRRWQGSVNRSLAILALVTLVIGLGIWRTVALQTKEVRRLADRADENSIPTPKTGIVWDLTPAPLFDNSAQMPWGSSTIPESMHVQYEQAEIDGTKAIVCRLPYRELLDNGERVRGVNFGSNIFAWHYPNLAIKVLNNSDETAMITDAIIHVDRVEVDERPLIVVQDQSFNRIQFRNFGWGEVANPTVTYSLARSEEMLKSGDNMFQATPVVAFDGDMYVPLPRNLASALADSPELQAAGEIVYGPEDQRTRVLFTTRVLQQIVTGRPVSPSFQYSVKLDSQRKADTPLHVSMSQVVDAQGGTDQFLLRVASDRSARYWLTIDLHSAGKKSLGTHRFILDVFVPRIDAKEVQAP